MWSSGKDGEVFGPKESIGRGNGGKDLNDKEPTVQAAQTYVFLSLASRSRASSWKITEGEHKTGPFPVFRELRRACCGLD